MINTIAVVGMTGHQSRLIISDMSSNHCIMFHVDYPISLRRSDIVSIFLLDGWENRDDAGEIEVLIAERREDGVRVFKIARV